MNGWIFYVGGINKGHYAHTMCKRLSFRAKTVKASAYMHFLRVDIKLKNPSSGFDLLRSLSQSKAVFNIVFDLFGKVNYINME